MKPMLSFSALSLALGLVSPAAAQHAQHAPSVTPSSSQPYAGQQTRAIASLSEEETRNLLEGKGQGLARPAELNGYPGPQHVLDLATELELTDEQKTRIGDALRRMKAAAVASGAKYLAAETAVDQAFRAATVDAASLRQLVAEADRLRGEVRMTHLAAHVEITPLLRPDQVASYARLRGYAPVPPPDAPPPRHR